MSTGPEGKAPADAEPAFIETADTQEQTVADAAESTPDVQRPGKNASKPEVQKWARDLGVSDEGTVKEIFARVDKETASSEQGGPVLVQDAQPDVPVKDVTPTEPPQTEAELLASASANQLSVQAATGEEPEHEKPGKVDLSAIPLDKLPIASQKGELLLRVEQNPAGIVVLSVSMFGMLGVPPVIIRAEQAGDLNAALKDLRTQAKAAE